MSKRKIEEDSPMPQKSKRANNNKIESDSDSSDEGTQPLPADEDDAQVVDLSGDHEMARKLQEEEDSQQDRDAEMARRLHQEEQDAQMAEDLADEAEGKGKKAGGKKAGGRRDRRAVSESGSSDEDDYHVPELPLSKVHKAPIARRSKPQSQNLFKDFAFKGKSQGRGGAGGGGGWTTKRRDNETEEEAVEKNDRNKKAKGKKRRLQTGKDRKLKEEEKKTKGKAKNYKGKKSPYSSDEDDSDDGFVVDDEEDVEASQSDSEESELDTGESDDSEEEERTKKKQQKQQKAKQKMQRAIEIESSDDGEGDLSDEAEVEDEDEGVDKVQQLLDRCAEISGKMQRAQKQYNMSGEAKGESEELMTPMSPVSLKRGRPKQGAGQRVTYQQKDIKYLDEKLVLKPYQIVGINWLSTCHDNNVNGVLADEMGLGKTVQTIAHLALLRTRAEASSGGSSSGGPHLVVVPASVLHNWSNELGRFCPTLGVQVYHGSQAHRDEIQRGHRKTFGNGKAKYSGNVGFDVMLTTYSYFERESCSNDRKFLGRFEFEYLILDEGHSIKNMRSSRFQRLRQLTARHRLLLTGTPVQNRLEELLALLCFCMPKLFDGSSNQVLELFAAQGNHEGLRAIRKILEPFILRRRKADVLSQLNPKHEVVKKIALTKEQRACYDAVLKRYRDAKTEQQRRSDFRSGEDKKKRATKEERLIMELTENAGSITRGGAASSSRQDKGDKKIKHVFTELRKAANHPLLCRHRFVGEAIMGQLVDSFYECGAFGEHCTKEMISDEISTYSDYMLHQLCQDHCGVIPGLRKHVIPAAAIFESTKLKLLQGLLPKLINEGHRVLLFSQWTSLLDLFEDFLRHESMQLQFLRLDGSTPVLERQKLIDQFNAQQEISVFLLSTHAGGLGINLTAADTVILHDLDFNPHNDKQAEDRCHRIGQTKPVTVYKLVSENTVDEAIFQIAERKNKLHAELVDCGDKQGITAEEMQQAILNGKLKEK
jgi:SWI/SNF-related matrix-associated actin-dependent regulator 1 of chromatin subfamily A